MAKIDIAYGIHSIQALLKTSPERIKKIFLLKGRSDQRMQKIIQSAQKASISIEYCERKFLDTHCEGNHQGVLAHVTPGKTYDERSFYELIDNLLENSQEIPLLLVLDGVTDPHNLGACIRTADSAGVHAIIIPKDNSTGLTETARKVASGAAESVPLIAVTNLARTLKTLQDKGLWVSGAAGEANKTIFEADLSGPRVIVMGAEGSGMRRLTRETCDELIKIPMSGTVSSLNVSVATGITLFEVVRQRISI